MYKPLISVAATATLLVFVATPVPVALAADEAVASPQVDPAASTTPQAGQTQSEQVPAAVPAATQAEAQPSAATAPAAAQAASEKSAATNPAPAQAEAEPSAAAQPEAAQTETEEAEAASSAYRYPRDWRRRTGDLDRMRQQQRAWVEARRRARDAQHQAWLWWQDPVYESNKLWRDSWYDYNRDMARLRSDQMRDWARQQQDYMIGQEPFGPRAGYNDPYYYDYYGGGAPYGFGSGPWW